MPSDRELLAMCLRYLSENPRQAFDRAMLVSAIQERLKPDLDAQRMRDFLERLIDPEDLGHAVSHEVRQKVSVLLKRDE
jgi:hypothetical protein